MIKDEKYFREKIQNLLNDKDHRGKTYIDTVYDLEMVVKEAQEEVKKLIIQLVSESF